MKDLTGQKFGRLTVIEKTGKRLCGHIVWKCQCECGNIAEVMGRNLLTGHTKSCGCLEKEINEKIHIKHGDARHGKGKKRARLYWVWTYMKQRCLNPNYKSFKYYGGRGIKVCDEWKNDYPAFKKWALANGYDEELSLGRIDPDGDYCPENCQWIIRPENTRKQWRDKKRPRF